MNKKEFLEYYIRIQTKEGEVVIETDSTSKLKKVYNWIGKLSTYNPRYDVYLISHIKKERNRIYETIQLKIYFNANGSISIYNSQNDILLCHLI